MGASLCSSRGFNIFGTRAALSMDACQLFPQCVLVVNPLARGVQMWRLVTSPGFLDSGGSLGTPREYATGVEVAHDASWSPCSWRSHTQGKRLRLQVPLPLSGTPQTMVRGLQGNPGFLCVHPQLQLHQIAALPPRLSPHSHPKFSPQV